MRIIFQQHTATHIEARRGYEGYLVSFRIEEVHPVHSFYAEYFVYGDETVTMADHESDTDLLCTVWCETQKPEEVDEITRCLKKMDAKSEVEVLKGERLRVSATIPLYKIVAEMSLENFGEIVQSKDVRVREFALHAREYCRLRWRIEQSE